MAFATLQDLLGTLPETVFGEQLRRRQPAFWPGAAPPQVAELVSWSALLQVLHGGAFPLKRLRMTRRGASLPDVFFASDGRPHAQRICDLMEHGASAVFSPLDGHLQALDRLVSGIRAHTRDHVRTGAIVTTGAGGAFRLHFDNEDLLIVQVEGTKRWRLHPVPVPNPVRGMPAMPAPLESEVTVEYTLEAGDLLLVPAGYWHHCENGPERSLHLGVFFVPPSLPRAADSLRQRLLEDAGLRAPFTRGERGVEIGEAEIRARLAGAVARLSLTDLLSGGE